MCVYWLNFFKFSFFFNFEKRNFQNSLLSKFFFNVFAKILSEFSSHLFFTNYIVPLILISLCVNWLKIIKYLLIPSPVDRKILMSLEKNLWKIQSFPCGWWYKWREERLRIRNEGTAKEIADLKILSVRIIFPWR